MKTFEDWVFFKQNAGFSTYESILAFYMEIFKKNQNNYIWNEEEDKLLIKFVR